MNPVSAAIAVQAHTKPCLAPLSLKRRQWLTTALLGSLVPPGSLALTQRPLTFPRDFGSHPDTRTEWWYVTGHLRTGGANGDGASSAGKDSAAGTREFGFQLTFFRSRVAATQEMKSAFAARQLIFAHAAVTDVRGARLWHDQRIARAGFGVAQASESDTAIELRDWKLVRRNGKYEARIVGEDFRFTLTLEETQPLLLQGDQGYSRKGPQPQQASFYYSLPQLRASGMLGLQGSEHKVQGTAWLDHEWSDELLHPQAVGWDWIGMNLFDGSALTAFRLRDSSQAALWDGGSFRHPAMGPKARPHIFSPGEVIFQPVRYWTSPLTRGKYPVEWIVRTPADFYTVKAIVDNQELDSRSSTGAVYWEGLSELFDSNGKKVGMGYLEMTGYAKPLRI